MHIEHLPEREQNRKPNYSSDKIKEKLKNLPDDFTIYGTQGHLLEMIYSLAYEVQELKNQLIRQSDETLE